MHHLESDANSNGCAYLCLGRHLLFFLLDPIKQFEELKSTWLRALMESIAGLATGLALRNHPNRLNLLWFGVLIAFLVLFYQYIPRALAQNKLLVSDYDHYLFHLKINTVLMGMILIAGIDGTLLDHLRASQYRWSNMRLCICCIGYWVLASHCGHLSIVDARNGNGLSTISYGF